MYATKKTALFSVRAFGLHNSDFFYCLEYMRPKQDIIYLRPEFVYMTVLIDIYLMFIILI